MKKYFIAIIVLGTLIFSVTSAKAETDKVYKRVMSTQTIRCGYAEWSPFFIVDPNNKKLSGIMYDVWELIGKQLKLKIEWTSFIGWGEIIEAVNTNKIDAFCVGVWPDSGRIKNMLLTRPVFYTPLFLFARTDDARFDNNYTVLNNPKMTVVGQDGDLTSEILALKFPNAKTAHIPPMAQQGDLFITVAAKKGDVTISDLPYAEEYMKSNPGKMKRVKGPPVSMLPLAMPLAPGEYQLKNMLDMSLTFLINDGIIDRLIKEYKAKETYPPRSDVQTQ